MEPVVVDFETRSRVALDKTNAHKYACDPSTEVLCGSFTWDDGYQVLWHPDDEFPCDHADTAYYASNAEFEYEIWNNVCVPHYGWPPLSPGHIRCLQARAAYAGYPRNVEDVGQALGIGGKDPEGRAAMLKLTKPDGGKLSGCHYVGGEFIDDPYLHAANARYCLQDGRIESAIRGLTPPLPDSERRLWLAHREINARGIPIDRRLCENVSTLATWERERLGLELQELSGGKVRTPNCVQALLDWLREKQGLDLPTTRKEIVGWVMDGCSGQFPRPMDERGIEKVIEWLRRLGVPFNGGDWDALAEVAWSKYLNPLSPAARRALEIRTLCRDAAISKFAAILNHAMDNDRCYGAHAFYTAGTGRFASPGVNFNNLRRLNEDDLGENLALADRLSAATGADLIGLYNELQLRGKGVVPTLGSLPRLAVKARDGHKIDVCDYSSIECRVLHWLAADTETLDLIRAFDAGNGYDLYTLAAAKMFHKHPSKITKTERQRGKVMILGAGYLSGGAKFQGFCAQYGIAMPRQEADDIIAFYRRTFECVPRFWYTISKAAIKTVETGVPTQVGVVKFFMQGGTLNIELPSGRCLKYVRAHVAEKPYQKKDGTWGSGKDIAALDHRTGGVRMVKLPTLIENIVQAISRDLLADALLKCREERLPVILHCYDEIVLETAESDDKSLTTLRDIMRSTPSWAKGLPVDAKGGSGRRYIK